MSSNVELSGQFTDLMETLLSGAAICEYRYPRLHALLGDENADDRSKAEEVLALLGRRLACTNEIFYAVYLGHDSTVEESVTRRFDDYLVSARYICEFFDLLRVTQRGGEVFEPGDRFKRPELLLRINASQEHRDAILRIATLASSRTRTTEAEAALNAVIEKLTRQGYLHQSSRLEQEYVVTGELELFNQWVSFVADHEGIDLDSELENEPEEETQESLPL